MLQLADFGYFLWVCYDIGFVVWFCIGGWLRFVLGVACLGVSFEFRFLMWFWWF